MNREITIAQWRNFQHHNHKHKPNAPRTAREAFGCDFDAGHRDVDTFVLIVAVAAFLIGLGVVWF